jgi:hypothetical protein
VPVRVGEQYCIVGVNVGPPGVMVIVGVGVSVFVGCNVGVAVGVAVDTSCRSSNSPTASRPPV